MRLVCHPTVADPPELRPAPQGRAWLDELPESYGYRCLPLTIANSHGWEVLCNAPFEATWSGERAKEAIDIRMLADGGLPPMSHFGSGILTFHVGWLFRTPPGLDLWVQGPVNQPKDGIAALTGVIETDWSPYTFTMNWQFTRPNVPVRFAAGEPFCHLFPTPRGLLERVEPEIRELGEDPEFEADYLHWSEARQTFNVDLLNPDSDARKSKWQKDYYRGYTPRGAEADADHRVKLRLKKPIDTREK